MQRPWVPIGIAAAAPETLWLWLCLLLRRGSAKGFHGNPQARSPTPDYFILFFFLLSKEKISRFPQKEPFHHKSSPPPTPPAGCRLMSPTAAISHSLFGPAMDALTHQSHCDDPPSSMGTPASSLPPGSTHAGSTHVPPLLTSPDSSSSRVG